MKRRVPQGTLLAAAMVALSACAPEESPQTFYDDSADVAAARDVCAPFRVEAPGADLNEMYPTDTKDARDLRLLCQYGSYRKGVLTFPLTSEATFDMCFDRPESTGVAVGYGVDLNKAKWFAFLAANQYSHYAHLAPVLERMGFGDVGDGDSWVQGAVQTAHLRERDQINEALSDQELTPEDFDPDGKRIRFAPVWIRDMVQKVVSGKKIQFFSAGTIEMVESDVDGVLRAKFVDKSTQFFWAQHRTAKSVVISFRGTEATNSIDIETDLNLIKEDLVVGGVAYGAVHAGFLGAHHDVEAMLREKLEAESGQGLRIWITGHSLGAAMATLASTTIMDVIEQEIRDGMPKEQRYQLAGVYTFGSPRVGNQDFVDEVESKYKRHGVSAMRFRYGNDTVTRYPKFYYEHVGYLMHFTKNRIAVDATGEPGLQFDYAPTDQDPGTSNWLFWESAADHSMINYYAHSLSALDHYGELSERCEYNLDGM